MKAGILFGAFSFQKILIQLVILFFYRSIQKICVILKILSDILGTINTILNEKRKNNDMVTKESSNQSFFRLYIDFNGPSI
jgi:hypothetical protein